MKLALVFAFLILGYQSYAVAIQKTHLTTANATNAPDTIIPANKQVGLISPIINNTLFSQAYLLHNNTTTYNVDFKQSQIQLSETTLIPVFLQRNKTSLFNDAAFNEKNIPFKGANARFTTASFSFEVAYFNKNSAEESAEILVLQSSYTVLSADDFNLAISGKIVTTNNVDYRHEILGVNEINKSIEPIVVNSSLSLSGTYLLTESWAVTGSVTSSFINDEITKSLTNKSSDNMALIGTTYSF